MFALFMCAFLSYVLHVRILNNTCDTVVAHLAEYSLNKKKQVIKNDFIRLNQNHDSTCKIDPE